MKRFISTSFVILALSVATVGAAYAEHIPDPNSPFVPAEHIPDPNSPFVPAEHIPDPNSPFVPAEHIPDPNSPFVPDMHGNGLHSLIQSGIVR